MVARTDVVKVLVCNFDRAPFLVHNKRRGAAGMITDLPLGKLLLTVISINVVTELKLDDVTDE